MEFFVSEQENLETEREGGLFLKVCVISLYFPALATGWSVSPRGGAASLHGRAQGQQFRLHAPDLIKPDLLHTFCDISLELSLIHTFTLPLIFCLFILFLFIYTLPYFKSYDFILGRFSSKTLRKASNLMQSI